MADTLRIVGKAKGRKSDAGVSVDQIEQQILVIRGQRVILANDLARMYGVPVKRLNQAVKRNSDRFPEDFVFQLSAEEIEGPLRSQIVTLNELGPLRSQIVTLNDGRSSRRGKHQKYLPYAFTEHGAIMAANVLRSPRAVKVSVFVVRAFVKLREMMVAHRDLAHKLDDLERKLQKHDTQILALIQAIRELMKEPEPKAKPMIGFHTEAGGRSTDGIRSSGMVRRRR